MRTMIDRLFGLRGGWLSQRRRTSPGDAGAPCAHTAARSAPVERRKQPARRIAPHPAARRLAQQIDRAVQRGQLERADRLARDAARIMHTSPRLTERIARLRLAQGRAEAALSTIESASMKSASMRLLRATCLVELGRVAEAHLDLREWSRKSAAPMAARRLLALLESGSNVLLGMKGDRNAAAEALLLNLRQIEDPRTLELLVIDAAAEGSNEHAEHWAQRLLLASRWTDDEDTNSIDPAMLLETFGLDAAKIDRGTPPASAQQVETLAMEMIAMQGIEQVMPALIRAQEETPDVRAVELMYEAARTALDSLSNQASMCESLARLAMLLDRRGEAAHWAQRGAEINPMSASLARLVHELAGEPDQPIEQTADAGTPMRRKAA